MKLGGGTIVNCKLNTDNTIYGPYVRFIKARFLNTLYSDAQPCDGQNHVLRHVLPIVGVLSLGKNLPGSLQRTTYAIVRDWVGRLGNVV